MHEDTEADLILDGLLEHDSRYPRQAYGFVLAALRFTAEQLSAPRHVSGQELSWGIRDYAIQQYGIATRLVLEQWRLHRTRDFGEIVFTLVESGLMRKTDEDCIDDFNEVYDFDEVFVKQYRIVVDASTI